LPIKYADLTVKKKPSSSIYLQQNKPLTNSEIDRVMKEGGPETFVIDPYDKKKLVQKRIKCHLQHR
jgi:hypothetical protein